LTIEETLDKPELTNNDVALVVHRPVESPATSACEEDDGRRIERIDCRRRRAYILSCSMYLIPH